MFCKLLKYTFSAIIMSIKFKKLLVIVRAAPGLLNYKDTFLEISFIELRRNCIVENYDSNECKIVKIFIVLNTIAKSSFS